MNKKWNNSQRALLNTSRGPSKSKNTRKIPAEPGRIKETRKGRKRKKKEKEPERKCVGACNPWGGGWKLEEVSISGEAPHWGSSVWTEGEPHSPWEENMATSVWQRDRVRPAHRVLTPALPTQHERHIHHCRQGLGAGMWVPGRIPRQRTAVGYEETSWRDGSEGGAL